MSKYKVPKLKLMDAKPEQRAEFACVELADCHLTDDCTDCVFKYSDWTTEREAEFLEWESNQSKGQ